MKTAYLKGAVIAICGSAAMLALAQAPGPGEEKTVVVPDAEPIPSPGASKHDGSDMGTTQQGLSALEADPKSQVSSVTGFIQEVDLTTKATLAQSRLASGRASDPQVKALSETLIADYAAMAPKLTSLASMKEADKPEELDQPRKTVVSRLEKLSGAEFDQAYVEQIVHDSDNTVAFYEEFSEASEDQDVRAFISQSLPIIKRHRDRATAIYEE